MKTRTLLFSLCIGLALAFAGCCEDETGTGLLDPNATIKIRPAASALRSTGHLTGLQIVQLTDGMYFQHDSVTYERGFSPAQRDTVEPCLKMWATDIIDQEGNYHTRFIEATDCVLIRIHNLDQESEWIDTIAYVPNQVLRSAQAIIKPAYDEGDYATCYQVFDSAFVFIPITGAEWRALKEQGLE
jgi:hypothetical protein